MKGFLSVAAVGVSLAMGGCATKSYVDKNIDPLNSKLDAQAHTLSQTAQSLQKTQQSLEADETILSATRERAVSADSRAGDALARAGEAAAKAAEAGDKADRATHQANVVDQDVSALKSQLASLDDYKKVSAATLNFRFNSEQLDSAAKEQLDLAAALGSKYRRYFIAVEGFADQIGSEAYNTALSRRRAEAVVAYLVSRHNIPVYRIQMIGLGMERPVDEGKNPSSRAKNRRVEITVYSADQSPIAMK